MAPRAPAPWVSPYVWSAPDFAGLRITLTVVFDTNTLLITTVTVTVDPGCQYSNVYFGLGADGTPNTAAAKFLNNAGTVTVVGTLLTQLGFTTIADIANAEQITAGP